MRRLIYIVILLMIPCITLSSKNYIYKELREYVCKDTLILEGVFKTTIQFFDSIQIPDNNPIFSVYITDTLDNIILWVSYKGTHPLNREVNYDGYVEVDGNSFVILSKSHTMIDSLFQLTNEKKSRRFKADYYVAKPQADPPTWTYAIYQDFLFLRLVIDKYGRRYGNLLKLIKKREVPL